MATNGSKASPKDKHMDHTRLNSALGFHEGGKMIARVTFTAKNQIAKNDLQAQYGFVPV